MAGSGSRQEAICDVVLFKNEKVYLVEVKSTRAKKYYPSSRPEQFAKLRTVALAHHTIPLLAVKFKNREWKEIDLTEGIPKVVRDTD